MKFSEKLQKLRKENNLSQEQLADKLDVSRQSVSKWESGQTYPEMDKLLTMCKLFNVTLDDLTNDEINIQNVKPKNKNTFDNLVDDVMYIIDKTYLMFTNMEPKERGKCIGELIIIFIILLLFRIPFQYIISIGDNLLYYLPLNYIFMNLWTFIINIVYLILFVFTYLYIYKTYFLDKYKEKEKTEEIKKETPKENIKNDIVEEIKEENTKNIKEKKHKNHTFGTTLYEILGSIVTFCFKSFLIFISIPFIISFIFVTLTLFLLIALLIKGVFFIGFITCTIGAIILNWLLLKLIFAFLFNYKPKFNFMFIPFIIGLSLIGIGTGFSIFNILSIDYIDESPNTKFELVNKEYIYEYTDNLLFHNNKNNKSYIVDESLGNNIKVNIEYYKDINSIEYMSSQVNIYTIIDFWNYNRVNKNIINLIIDNLKDKKIYNYELLYENNITIYASSETIEKLNTNYDNYINYLENNRHDFEINYYENEIYDLQKENEDLYNEINNLNIKIENYKDENENLKNKINEYKQNLEQILGS